MDFNIALAIVFLLVVLLAASLFYWSGQQEHRLDAHDERIEKLEEEISEIKSDIEKLKNRLSGG